MQSHDLALIIIAFISEVFGTLSGFGSSALFIPLGSSFEKFHFLLALTAILHCFSNISKIFLFKKFFQKDIFLKLFFPSILLTILGAAMSGMLPVPLLKSILGVVLILVTVLFVLQKMGTFKFPPYFAILISGLSGFSTGLVGTGGALRGIALSSLSLEKNSFVMLSSSIDFLGDFSRMLIYFQSGFMDWSQWFYVPALGLAAYLGALLGKKILSLLPQKYFEGLVAVIVFASGVLMLF